MMIIFFLQFPAVYTTHFFSSPKIFFHFLSCLVTFHFRQKVMLNVQENFLSEIGTEQYTLQSTLIVYIIRKKLRLVYSLT